MYLFASYFRCLLTFPGIRNKVIEKQTNKYLNTHILKREYVIPLLRQFSIIAPDRAVFDDIISFLLISCISGMSDDKDRSNIYHLAGHLSTTTGRPQEVGQCGANLS